MKLVIEIPDEEYELVRHENKSFRTELELMNAVANGTPLPKGHGDLVDRDAINDRFYNIWKELESYSNKPHWKELLDKWSMCMDTAEPIIKADGGGEDADSD